MSDENNQAAGGAAAALAQDKGAADAAAASAAGADKASGGTASRARGDMAFDFDGFSDDVKPTLEARQYKNVNDIATALVNAEKLIGGDKVLKPVNGKIADWFGQHKDVVGVPEKADAYTLPDVKLPEGMTMDDAVVGKAREFAHKMNLPQDLFAQFAQFVIEDRVGLQQAGQTAMNAAIEKDLSALKAEWGKDYDANVEIGRQAARKLGMEKSDLEKLEGPMGTAAILRHFAKLGALMTEGGIVTGEGGGTSAPEAALATLKADTQFQKTLLDEGAVGHKEAQQRWSAALKAVADRKDKKAA